MYELLVGKGAANRRRIPAPQTGNPAWGAGNPLERVREDGMPMGDVLDKSALYGVEQSRVPIHRARACHPRSLDTPALRSVCLLAYN